MTEHRFDGRVVIVTGAGRGIGRAYAQLLASLGATVVANDIDDVEGVSHVGDVADSVVARSLVDGAMNAHGRVDALINNAGNIAWAPMPDANIDTLTSHIAVHVYGAFNTVHAAWPHMAAAGYGRIVNTTSSGALGLRGNVGYATAKGAVIGMTRTLAVEGAPVGIKVNAIAPAAFTRMAGPRNEQSDAMDPSLVAPMAVYLAHETCPVTGEIYTAGAGRFARLFIASTTGAVTNDVAADWEAINDESSYFVPRDLMEWSGQFLKHLD